MRKLVVIDNYDSFTYNIVHIVEKILGHDIGVFRNNEVSVKDLSDFDHFILSPGPGLPKSAGITFQVLQQYHATKKILGVCLGHQAIGEFFGASLKNLDKVFHGVSTTMTVIKEDVLFKGLPSSFDAGRYHSWVVEKASLKGDVDCTAIDEQGNCMALAHKKYNIKGVQFHPESVLTGYGEHILRNWLES